MEVLPGIQKLFTHSLEHKVSAEETNILTEKERAWAHYHNQIFFPERIQTQQVKERYHLQAKTKRNR